MTTPPAWALEDQEFGPRPYTLTRGRTHANWDLRLETLVHTTATAAGGCLSPVPEHETICELARSPRSVAELSALLRIPLGVTRVLVSDLADSGLVYVHEAPAERAATDLLERVLHGLNQI
ncbi:DUF742 domain-containing protein [Streptomyces vinaceus]|uniref:DUF742 domain-containing protein n=1 Tax=Streptomyces vinaceus TaxID=1960 RepID=UPI00381A10E3